MQHLTKYKNPQLEGEEREGAFKFRGGTNRPTETFLHINHEGFITNQINPDAYFNNLSQYWAKHEKKLMLITAGCLLFLVMKLMG
jgi:hypothetical protein